MKRTWLIPIAALILLVGAGAAAGLTAARAASEKPNIPPDQVKPIEKLTQDTPVLSEPASSVSSGGEQFTPPPKTELKYPNLGSMLNQLAARVEAGEATARDAAGDAPLHREASVAVTIYLSGSVDGVVSFLEDNGGDPRNVGQDYIEAYVPVTLLGPVSEQPGVLRVRAIVPPQPASSESSGGEQFTPPPKTALKYPNLGSMLNQMADRVEAGEATAEDAAAAAPVYRAESVAVTIYLSGNVDEVVSFLEDHGGSPRNVGEDYIEAYVPVSLLGPVSEQPGVLRVREIMHPQPDGGG